VLRRDQLVEAAGEKIETILEWYEEDCFQLSQ